MTLGADREPEIEALRVDRYLESILVARERGASVALHDPQLNAELRAAAERLSSDLVRVHPSFRFEERLASRLADLAGNLRMPAATAESRLPQPLVVIGSAEFDPVDLLDPARLVDDDPFAIRARPLLIGGALTSAAISLAGAALVAWRLSRPAHPMVRAIRAVHDRPGREGSPA